MKAIRRCVDKFLFTLESQIDKIDDDGDTDGIDVFSEVSKSVDSSDQPVVDEFLFDEEFDSD